LTRTAKTVFKQTAFILLFALIVRAVVLAMGSDTFADDPDSYARLAVNYSESGVLGFENATNKTVSPTAFRPPLYPWLLSFLVVDGELRTTGVGLLHLMMGIASVWLTLSIGRRLGLGLAWLAACAVALDPLLIRASQLLMTETLATFTGLLAWRLWLAIVVSRSPVARGEGSVRRQVLFDSLLLICLGLAFGLAILARPTAAPWAALCVIGLFFVGDRCWKRNFRSCMIVSCGVMVCVVPWALRNWSQLGKPIWATSHGGYTLLLANNPTLYQHFIHDGPSRDWDAESFHAAWAHRAEHEPSELLNEQYWLSPDVDMKATVLRDSSELDDNRLAYSVARATIERHPGTFLLSCVYRGLWFWALWPNDSQSLIKTAAIGLWYAFWTILAIVGFCLVFLRRELRCWLPALLLIFCLTGLHAIYWGNMRMRGPLMPAVYLLALLSFPPIDRSHRPSP
jgi:hypothetical protein